jgi:hypothetical protein
MDDDSAERSRRGHALVAEDVHAIGLIILIGEPDHVMSENLALYARLGYQQVDRLCWR